MSFWKKNLKFLRTKNSFSQEELSEKIGLSRSTISALENGKFEPNIYSLIKLSNLFSVSIDSLINEDLSNVNPLTGFNNKVKILTISVDNFNNENIDFIPQKACAGYLNGYSDAEFIRELPKFKLHKKLNGTFRAFEIEGDSMLPIDAGSVVIGKYIESIKEIKVSERYILVTKSDGIIFKKISNDFKTDGFLICSSDNPVYDPFKVDFGDILEIWHFYAFIGFVSIYDQNPLNKIQDYLERIDKKVTKDFYG